MDVEKAINGRGKGYGWKWKRYFLEMMNVKEIGRMEYLLRINIFDLHDPSCNNSVPSRY